MLSLHIIRHDFTICFPNVIKSFDPYVTFYLRGKCAMFFGACINCNAMKRNIEICLLSGQKEETYMRISQL